MSQNAKFDVERGLNTLSETDAKIQEIVQWCTISYQQNGDNKEAQEALLKQSQEYTVAVLQNIAFNVESASQQLTHFLDLQTREVDKLCLEVDAFRNRLRHGREVTGRNEYSRLHSAKATNRNSKMREMEDFQEPSAPSSRPSLNFNSLDHVGTPIQKVPSASSGGPFGGSLNPANSMSRHGSVLMRPGSVMASCPPSIDSFSSSVPASSSPLFNTSTQGGKVNFLGTTQKARVAIGGAGPVTPPIMPSISRPTSSANGTPPPAPSLSSLAVHVSTPRSMTIMPSSALSTSSPLLSPGAIASSHSSAGQISPISSQQESNKPLSVLQPPQAPVMVVPAVVERSPPRSAPPLPPPPPPPPPPSSQSPAASPPQESPLSKSVEDQNQQPPLPTVMDLASTPSDFSTPLSSSSILPTPTSMPPPPPPPPLVVSLGPPQPPPPPPPPPPFQPSTATNGASASASVESVVPPPPPPPPPSQVVAPPPPPVSTSASLPSTPTSTSGDSGAPGRNALLESIRAGKQLKKVDTPPPPTEIEQPTPTPTTPTISATAEQPRSAPPAVPTTTTPIKSAQTPPAPVQSPIIVKPVSVMDELASKQQKKVGPPPMVSLTGDLGTSPKTSQPVDDDAPPPPPWASQLKKRIGGIGGDSPSPTTTSPSSTPSPSFTTKQSHTLVSKSSPASTPTAPKSPAGLVVSTAPPPPAVGFQPTPPVVKGTTSVLSPVARGPPAPPPPPPAPVRSISSSGSSDSTPPPPPPSEGRNALLDSIRAGKQLKKVHSQPPDDSPKLAQTTSQRVGGGGEQTTPGSPAGGGSVPRPATKPANIFEEMQLRKLGKK